MKTRLLSLIQKAVAPAALVVALAAFSPVTGMAANRGGGFNGGHAGGFSGGHLYAAPNRGNFSGGHSFAERPNVRENFNRGYGGRDFRGGYDRGRDYGRGFGFGVGVYPSYGYAAPAYGYAAPVCNPAGFYDQYGVWRFYPGCAVPY